MYSENGTTRWHPTGTSWILIEKRKGINSNSVDQLVPFVPRKLNALWRSKSSRDQECGMLTLTIIAYRLKHIDWNKYFYEIYRWNKIFIEPYKSLSLLGNVLSFYIKWNTASDWSVCRTAKYYISGLVNDLIGL